MMQQSRRTGVLYALGMLAGLCFGDTAAVAAASINSPVPPRLDASELPASGTRQTLLHIGAFGRYTIVARSAQGTALQLVDRMSGPGPIQGEAGRVDGRLDLFLERGDYKLLTRAAEQGSGVVSLSVSRAREMSPAQPPRLVELRLERNTLDDLQQRSYWLQIEERRTVAIEAAGRNLADLRLWKDGNWLVDASPAADLITPSPGKPLGHRLLVADLNPGLYLLSAYGGPAQPWAESAEEHPFFLRMGIPELGDVERQRHVTTPFGIDRWRIPAGPDYFRLELPTAEAAELGLRAYDANHPFEAPYTKEAVTKKSIPPVAELRDTNRRSWRILTVQREAGQPYLLQFFSASRYQELGGSHTSADYWVETVHSGHAEDEIDSTAILTRYTQRGPADLQFVASTAIPLDDGPLWQRRFNLLDEATLFFEVKRQGRYRFSAEGVEPSMRIEPFFISPPPRYQAPEFARGPLQQELDPGLYVLSLRPGRGADARGVVTLSAGLSGAAAAEAMANARVALLNPKLRVDERTIYRIDLNEQPGVTQGIVVRRLPIDLAVPLHVAQAAQQSITTRIKVGEKGKVRAIAEDGHRLAFAIDGGAPVTEQMLPPGTYTIVINNEGDHALDYAISVVPQRVDPDYPLPLLAGELLNSLPKLPLLDEQHPYFYQTEREQRTTVNLNVSSDALYRLESTGLLQTAGILRTRTITRFDSQSANGVGRNFLIAQYLREGDYQLTAQAEGKSRGPLGLRLTTTPLFDGGMLRANTPARHTLRAGEGLAYRFHIDAAGHYRVYTLGLGRRFAARLEDSDGWPLLAPGSHADVSRWFEPGDYRFIVLPQAVDARAVTLLEPVVAPPSFSGHGPHAIGLGERITHQWLEPTDEGGARTPDQWSFVVPAEITAQIAMSAQMAGVLMRDGESVAEISGERGWSGRLPAGAYLLAMRSQRPDNRLDYWLRVSSEELVAGQSRGITAPAELTVAIGSRSPFELSSFGDEDVRARLYAGDGSLLASSDDRPDDWNFFIAAQLAPGRYRLSVQPVAGAAAQTRITLRVPQSHEEPPLKLPAHYTISDTALHYYPLPAMARGELLAFVAHSEDEVGVAIERQRDSHWSTLGQMSGNAPTVVVPVGEEAAAGELRLRVWSITRGGHPIIVSGAQVTPPHQGESTLLGSGVTLTPLKGFSPALGVAVVDLARPGQFALASHDAELLWGASPDRALVALDRERLAADSATLWLARPLGKAGSARVRASRLVLGAHTPLAMTLVQGSDAVLDLEEAGAATQVVLATSAIGLPGIRGWPASAAMANVGLGRRSAVLVRHQAQPASAALWGVSEQFGELPMQLRLFSFGPVTAQSLAAGAHDLSLNASASLVFKLPREARQLRLTLPAGVVAELLAGERPLATYWSEESPRSFTLDSDADRLRLYNTRPQAVRASLLLLPGDPLAATLTGKAFTKRRFAAAGVATLEVRLTAQEKAAGRRLHARGANATLSVIEQGGRILTGDALLLHDDARLLVEHGPGMFTAWLSDAQGNTAIDAGAVAAELTLPAQLALQGQAMAFRLPMASSGALALSSDTPLLIRVRSPGVAEQIHVFDAAVRLPLYLAKGEHTLVVEAPGAGPLGGRLEAHTLPIDALTEGLSERRMLAPGEARLYHFRLAQQGTIGVGARASLDTVNCTLFDGRGTELGRGLLQMHELQAGDYLLRVEAPADGQSVEVQAALVGVTKPDGGPPAEVIERYLQAAGLKVNN